MINWKGGVGKSTLSLHLGVGVRRRSNGVTKVLLVDLDPQCNLSFLALGVSKYIDTVYSNNGQASLKEMFECYFSSNQFDVNNAIVKQPISSSPGKVWAEVDIILSHQELVLVDLRLARERKSGASHKEETLYELAKISILHEALAQVSDEYDYIFLDCPPNINLVTQNALFASDYFIIPAIPDFLSTIGISLIKDKMEDLNNDFKSMIAYSGMVVDYNDTEFSGIIFNMVTERSQKPKDTHEQTIASVSNQHPGKPFTNYLTLGDGISVASENNYTVYSHQYLPKARQNAVKQSNYLDRIVDELLQRIP
jgi:chromosome partitioning protein